MGPKPRKKLIMPPRSFIKMRHYPRMVLDSPGLAFITRVLMLSIGAVLNDTQNPAITLETNRSECPSFIQPRSLIAFFSSRMSQDMPRLAVSRERQLVQCLCKSPSAHPRSCKHSWCATSTSWRRQAVQHTTASWLSRPDYICMRPDRRTPRPRRIFSKLSHRHPSSAWLVHTGQCVASSTILPWASSPRHLWISHAWFPPSLRFSTAREVNYCTFSLHWLACLIRAACEFWVH